MLLSSAAPGLGGDAGCCFHPSPTSDSKFLNHVLKSGVLAAQGAMSHVGRPCPNVSGCGCSGAMLLRGPAAGGTLLGGAGRCEALRLPSQVSGSRAGLGVRPSLGHLLRSVTVRAAFTSGLKTISQIYLLARRRVPSRVITELNSGLFRNPLRAALGVLCGFRSPV